MGRKFFKAVTTSGSYKSLSKKFLFWKKSSKKLFYSGAGALASSCPEPNFTKVFGAAFFKKRLPNLLLRREIHCDPVNAVAQAGGGWAVFEDVAKMAAALAAMGFDADHAEGAVDRGGDCAFDRVVEAWPAGAAVEFGAGDEQRCS
jgi:hypothetical protein